MDKSKLDRIKPLAVYLVLALALDMYFNNEHEGVLVDGSTYGVIGLFLLIALYRLFIQKPKS